MKNKISSVSSRLKTLFLAAVIISYSITRAQPGAYHPKVSMAIETQAFLKGQHAALQKVAAEFPNLQNEVADVQQNAGLFGSAFQAAYISSQIHNKL